MYLVHGDDVDVAPLQMRQHRPQEGGRHLKTMVRLEIAAFAAGRTRCSMNTAPTPHKIGRTNRRAPEIYSAPNPARMTVLRNCFIARDRLMDDLACIVAVNEEGRTKMVCHHDAIYSMASVFPFRQPAKVCFLGTSRCQ